MIDGELKHLIATGNYIDKKKVNVITNEMEEELLQKLLLGDDEICSYTRLLQVFTNHSFITYYCCYKATYDTRVHGDTIMQRTRQWSSQGVRTYKRETEKSYYPPMY